MPSAPHLHEIAVNYFGDISDAGPSAYLESRGFKLTKSWCWKAPSRVRKLSDMTDQERFSVSFLVLEWDYGGVLYHWEPDLQ
jgi:hypothetical protein